MTAAIAFLGCGEDDPRPVAARVGATTIDEAQVVAYLHGTLREQGKPPRSYDPPAYRGCVAEKRQVGAGDGRRSCVAEYAILRAQALRGLVRASWLEREAERRGIRVDDAHVEHALADRRELLALQGTPSEAGRDPRRLALSEPELRRRLVTERLGQQIAAATAVPKAAIASYYHRNLNEFGHPPRRRVRLVQARAASEARAALARGEGDDSVLITGFVAEPALDRAVFSTPVGRTAGPLRTPSGWYAFEVERAIPATQRTLAEATPAIEPLLRTQMMDRRLYDRYGDITTCAERYRVPEVPECLERRP